jgi:hypothetical protein
VSLWYYVFEGSTQPTLVYYSPFSIQSSSEVAQGPEQTKHLLLIIHKRSCSLLDRLGPVTFMVV